MIKYIHHYFLLSDTNKNPIGLIKINQTTGKKILIAGTEQQATYKTYLTDDHNDWLISDYINLLPPADASDEQTTPEVKPNLKSRRLSDEQRERLSKKAAEYREKGRSYRDIALCLGVSVSTTHGLFCNTEH